MTVFTGEERVGAAAKAPRRAARAPRNGGGAPRARLNVDERRAQLLELGAHLFSVHSYDGLSVDDIAQAAGISKGLLYHYFPSKRDFYVETIRAAASQLLEENNSAVLSDPSRPPLERARAAIGAYLDYAERHGSAFSTLLRGGIGSDAEVFEIIEGVRRAFIDRFLTRAPIGEPTPQVRNAIRGFIGFSEGVALDWLEHGDVTKDEVRELLVELLERTFIAAMASKDKKRQTSE
jgi:AcrR family transcriptional regulator